MSVVATSGDAPAANEVEDELFGDLTADDHADQHERGVNPQQAAGAPHHAVAIAPAAAGGGGGGLAGHETRANEAAFRKMGYLEAYDATKEERLQGGFEAGYRETVDVATSVGLRLGRLVGRTAAVAGVAGAASTGSQGKHDDDTTGGDGDDNCDDDNDERVEKEAAAAAAARLAAKTIRTFLDGQLTQPSDAVCPEEALQQVRDLEKEVNEQFCDGQKEAACTTALRTCNT